MATQIHPHAVVDPSAQLGEDVVVGPFAIIGADVQLGDRCQVEPHAVVAGPSHFGSENRFFSHCSVGSDPQDKKFSGEPTYLEVGDRNHFREFCTVNRGTVGGGGRTTMGSDNLMMAYSHVAHDCHVGNEVVFANSGTLAGHVDVGDFAAIGAFCAVHQFCKVGRYAYLGGFTVATKDVLPFSLTVGQRAACVGLNKIGLQRRGFTGDEIKALDRAYKTLLHSKLNTTQALEALREGERTSAIDELIEFVETSERGVVKAARGGRRGG
ncbi:MAG: acyl-ACP--UDP-N-acetylglucosamine O-acyltransferase [Acidobacteriota bacterium]